MLLDLKFPNTQVNPFPPYIYNSQTYKPSCDNWTITRIGSCLNFNYGSCPRNSIMLNSTRVNAKPLHDNCPQVFIIGARKGGTTSLYHYLCKHPDFSGIGLGNGPLAGETFYFSSPNITEGWNSYISSFPSNNMTGDASVDNLVDCRVPERLYTTCGRASKVIILLRDPIKRYQSNFRMRVRLGTKHTKPFSRISTSLMTEIHHLYESFVHRNINISDLTANVNALLCLYPPSKNCIYEGMYYVHLHNWFCNFPAENILILNTEEFFNNTKFIFSQILNFVGLLNKIVKVKYNYGGKVEDEPDHRLLSSSDKEKLQAIYKLLNEKLFDLLKWHDVNWST